MPPQAPPTSGSDPNDDIHDAIFLKRGCCFFIPCLESTQRSNVGSVWWQRIGTVDSSSQSDVVEDKRWWIRGWGKMREWSELVAGPKWKTFIRRLSRNRNYFCGGVSRGHLKFQYDPSSYALNFDEGPTQNAHFDEGFVNLDFSSRYASLPVSTKCSMDLGKE